MTYRFQMLHLWLPILVFLLAFGLIELGSWDFRLADFWYQLQGGSWTFKQQWWSQQLIHQGGRLAFAIACSLLFVWCITTSIHKRVSAYLLCAVLASTVLINLGKQLLHGACAWDLQRYGGPQPDQTLWQQLWLANSPSHCFPAGHASAGYAWIALYFVGRHYRSGWRWLGLLFALMLGGIFGLGQQLRGAHFVSHDLASLMLCYLVAYFLFYRFKLNGSAVL